MYMDNNELQPKEYSFKIQRVRKTSKGEDERTTVGKVKVCCQGETCVPLHPDALQHISIGQRPWLFAHAAGSGPIL